VEPAALGRGFGEHLAQRAPEPQRAVADREHRGAHPAALRVPEQVGPGLDRFPVAVGDRDQFLAAISAHPDEHQQAQLVLLQSHGHVDPVGPQVNEVDTGEIPGGEVALLGLPGLGQAGDRGRRKPGRPAEELPERRHEVPAGQAVRVEQREHLVDLRGLARVPTGGSVQCRSSSGCRHPANLKRYHVSDLGFSHRADGDHCTWLGQQRLNTAVVGATHGRDDGEPPAAKATYREAEHTTCRRVQPLHTEHPAGSRGSPGLPQAGRPARTEFAQRHSPSAGVTRVFPDFWPTRHA
jgi:hypothetical protein